MIAEAIVIALIGMITTFIAHKLVKVRCDSTCSECCDVEIETEQED